MAGSYSSAPAEKLVIEMSSDFPKGPPELHETEPEDEGQEQGSVTLDLTQDAIRKVSILSEPDQRSHERPDVAPDVIIPEVITKESWSDSPAHRDPDVDD